MHKANKAENERDRESNRISKHGKIIYIIVMTVSNYFQFIECGYDIFGSFLNLSVVCVCAEMNMRLDFRFSFYIY